MPDKQISSENQRWLDEDRKWREEDKHNFPEAYPPFQSIAAWVRRNYLSDKRKFRRTQFIIAPHVKGMWIFVCLCSKPHGTPIMTYHCDDSLQWLLKNFRETKLPDGTIRASGNCPVCHKFCDFRLLNGEDIEWSSHIDEVSAGNHKYVSLDRRYGRTASDDALDEQEERRAEQADPRYILMLTEFQASRRRERAYGIGANDLGETVKFKIPYDVIMPRESAPRKADPPKKPGEKYFSRPKQCPVLINPEWVVSIQSAPQEQTSL